jgi:hypothetical protein
MGEMITLPLCTLGVGATFFLMIGLAIGVSLLSKIK